MTVKRQWPRKRWVVYSTKGRPPYLPRQSRQFRSRLVARWHARTMVGADAVEVLSVADGQKAYDKRMAEIKGATSTLLATGKLSDLELLKKLGLPL